MDIIVDIEIHFNTTPYSFTNSLSSKQSTLSDSSPRQEQKEQQQPEQQHLELQREQLEQQQQEKLLEIIDQFILSLTKDYIWHKHHLKFQCRRKNSTPKQTKNMNLPASKQNIITLSSSTNIGQCVDDESFILYLLIQLSIKFDNTVISIKDNDGQFMLIDAADHIPSWINPESIENRVFIHKGNLQLIPIPLNPSQVSIYPSGNLSLERALDLILDSGINTQASINIQNTAFHSTAEYPEKQYLNTQNTCMYLHPDILHLLHYAPCLVTEAVDYFCNRDDRDMKAATILKTFPYQPPIKSSIKLTKMSFAQLLSQQFYAPKVYQMPVNNETEDYYQHDLGMKLTCAFEMLYINSQKEDRNTYSIEKYDFESDRQWTIYRGNLEKLGYFKQELQGSKLHITLLGIAKQNYLDNLKYDFPNPANVIDSILTRDSLPIESIVSVVEDSSVDWMKDAIEEEEHELNEDDFGLNEKEDENEENLMDSHSLSNEEKSDLVELGKIVNGFKAFVDKESDIIDGVSFPGEKLTEVGVSFDPDSFMSTILELLGVNDKNDVDTSTQNDEHIKEMDEESFRKSEDDEELGSEDGIEDVMALMDKELAQTNIGQDFQDIEEEEEEYCSKKGRKPINLNSNLVKNLLSSLEVQEGQAGPLSSIASLLGAKLSFRNKRN